MKALFIRFYILCKRQLKNPFFLFLLFGFPLFGLGIHTLEKNSQEKSDTISIAIYCENPDTFTQNCLEELTHISSFHFYKAESLASLETQVSSGYAECGYVFPNNFHSILLNGDLKRQITLYTSPSTLFASLSKEVVFACVFRSFAKDMAISYIKTSPIFDSIRENAIPMFSLQYQSYLNGTEDTSLFHLTYETISAAKEPNTIPPTFVPMPIRGIFAVLLFINTLTATIQTLEDKRKKLPISLFSSIAVSFLFLTLSGWFTLCLTKNYTSFLQESLTALFYFTLLYIFCIFFSHLSQNTSFLTASIPFFALGSMIFCPIFINLSSFLPIFSILEKFFLPYYYINLF